MGALALAACLAVAVRLAAAPSAAPAPAQPPATARWIDSALEDLARGRMEAAAGKLRLARWTAPGDPEATVLLAWVLAAQSQWEEAAALLEALDHDALPDGARAAARGLLAMAYQTLGRAQLAARTYGALLQDAPGAALAEKGLGELALQASRDRQRGAELAPVWPAQPAPGSPEKWRAEGERHLRAAIQRAPERADLYLALAESLMDARQWQQAEAVLKEAVRVNFRAPEVHYALGQLYERQGNAKAAASAYRRALEVDPSFLPARLRLERLDASGAGP